MKLEDLLNTLDFSYTIHDNNSLSLVDLTGANLGNIESEEYELNKDLALILIDRLSVYIHDYFIVDILEQLSEHNIKNVLVSNYNYNDVLLILKKYSPLFDEYIELLECLDNPYLFDISDICKE